MRYIIKLLAVVFLIINLSSCKQNVTQNDYPDADAVFLNIKKEYTLNDDGSMDYHYTHKLKLFSYLAFNGKYGETFVVYNPAFQKLKVKKSVTTNEQGVQIPTPDNAFNEVLPSFAANAPAYNGLREMVITHTGLEKNAMIDLDYSITTQKDFLPAMMSNEVLNNSSPVREYEIVVNIPKGKKLSYKLLNSDKKPDSTVNEKYVVYKWKFHEVPQQPLENFQPSDNSHLMRLIFSTADNFNTLTGKFMEQPAFKYELNNEMKNQTKEVINANKNELNIALGLQKKVVEEFNYFPIPSNYIGYKCRTAEEVWKSNGGTELEKAVLLNSLLRHAGIDSKIIAVSAPYFGIKDGISIMFDNYYVEAKLKNNEVINLSPIHVNENDAAYDLNGYLCYALEKNAKVTELPLINYINTIEVKGNLSLKAENSLEGNLNINLKDKENPFFRFAVNPESAKSILGNVKEAKIQKSDKDNSTIELTLENKKAFKKEKDYLFYTLPEAGMGLSGWGLNLLTEKRSTQVELPNNISETYDYSIQLPDNFTMLQPNLTLNIKNKAGTVNILIEQKGKLVTVKKEIKILKKSTELKNYDDLKALTEAWLNKKYRELVLIAK